MTQRPMPSLEDRHLRSHASAPSAAQSFGRQHASRLYAQREANETEALRGEVNRLERLIDVLISAQAPPNPLSLGTLSSSAPGNSRSLPLSPSPADPARAPAPASSASADRHDEILKDLEADDLARQLGELTLRTYHVEDPAKPLRTDKDLLKEAKRLFSDDAEQIAPAQIAQTAFAPLPSLKQGHFMSLSKLLARVPPRALAQQAATSYFALVTWWNNVISREQYTREEQVVFAALDAPSPTHHDASLPVSLALCFAVWSLGLVLLDYSAQGTAYAGKDSLNAHFSRYSRAGLALANAVESPTLETLRTMLLLACHETLVSPGEEGRVGVAMLALAAQACLQLDLHRDPDTLSTVFSPGEAEDRRNLFQATLLQDNQVASLIGRRFILLRSEDWNTRAPVDSDAQGVTDTGYGETHTMTSFLRALSVMTERITRAQFRSSPVPYSHILDLDGQLVDLVKCMPAFLKVESLPKQPDFRRLAQASLVSVSGLTSSRTDTVDQSLQHFHNHERFRLHRPFLSRAYADRTYAFSRWTCLSAARHLLCISESPAVGSIWGCATYVRISAATVLAIDLMFDSERQGANEDKAMVEKLVKHLSSFTTVSTIARRGSRLLQFLLDKIDLRSSAPSPSDPALRSKRLRRDSDSPGRSAFVPRRNPLPPQRSTSPDELKHKTPSSSASPSTDIPPPRSTLDRLPASTPAPPAAASAPAAVPPSPPTATSSGLRSAADEIASLDFPSLLGLEDSSTVFTFGYGSGSEAL
ncbi:hypothetical protein JCM10207_002172 [Rhodosporidiobolus poonsookiae]